MSLDPMSLDPMSLDPMSLDPMSLHPHRASHGNAPNRGNQAVTTNSIDSKTFNFYPIRSELGCGGANLPFRQRAFRTPLSRL